MSNPPKLPWGPKIWGWAKIGLMGLGAIMVFAVVMGYLFGTVEENLPTTTTTTTTVATTTTRVATTTTTTVPVDVQPAYCIGLLDRNWLDDDVVDQFTTCLDQAIPITVIGPDALLVAYCSGRHTDRVYVESCINEDTFDYRPILLDRLETFHTDQTLLYPAEPTARANRRNAPRTLFIVGADRGHETRLLKGGTDG